MHRFDYADVPYSAKPNLMFNKGALWSRFIGSVQDMVLSRLPAALHPRIAVGVLMVKDGAGGTTAAGLASAIRLKQLNPNLSVCVLEKAASLGAICSSTFWKSGVLMVEL